VLVAFKRITNRLAVTVVRVIAVLFLGFGLLCSVVYWGAVFGVLPDEHGTFFHFVKPCVLGFCWFFVAMLLLACIYNFISWISGSKSTK